MGIRVWSIVPVLLLVAALSRRALAGGWAVVDVADPPTEVVAADEVTIRYPVLAHGRPEAPVSGIESTVTLTHRETRQVVKVEGLATKDPVACTATFRLDRVREWVIVR